MSCQYEPMRDARKLRNERVSRLLARNLAHPKNSHTANEARDVRSTLWTWPAVRLCHVVYSLDAPLFHLSGTRASTTSGLDLAELPLVASPALNPSPTRILAGVNRRNNFQVEVSCLAMAAKCAVHWQQPARTRASIDW